MTEPGGKYAVLSMDVEDWHHTEYLKDHNLDASYSMLDGVEHFREILDEQGIPGVFFLLGELVRPHLARFRELADAGFEIGSHGWNHRRPLTMSLEEFERELVATRQTIEDALGIRVPGFRAPCFSMDRRTLDAVRGSGHLYDSSRMRFAQNPLYGQVNLEGFRALSPNIFLFEEFVEFQLSALPLAGKNIPVSGGGYLRMFPWSLMKRMIKKYLGANELHILYIHPFELSRRPNPPLPSGIGGLNKLRFKTGRASVAGKIRALIALLREEGFDFCTFADLREKIVSRRLEITP